MSELRTNRIVPRDGLVSGTGRGGGVIQVVYGFATTQVSHTSTSFIDIGLSATITPTRSDSKIIVQGNIGGIETSSDNNYGEGHLLRDSTVIIAAIDLGIGFSGDSTRSGLSSSFFILDEPASTSAIVYKVQFRNVAATGTITTQTNSSRSSILLMEVSG